MTRTTASTLMVSFAVFLTAVCSAQRTHSDTELVTVCEVLHNSREYSGKRIAVLGRVVCGAGITDRSCFLVEDTCSQPLVTNGHVWPNKVWLEFVYDDRKPFSTVASFQVADAAVQQKLKLIRQSTKLGCHKGLTFKQQNGTVVVNGWANLKDKWGIAFGKVVFRPKLKPEMNCAGGREGCGGWNETPVMLLVNGKGSDLTTFNDDKYPRTETAISSEPDCAP